ncbi:hypothetical protein BD769DRAFT_1655447 [Suillus cothurnatus]|nr:hypothetical protein BD769DRAFT_1655447 [Suillus cothurnatus]
MTLSFVDIPLELLPIIFDSVVRAQHLAFLCLVNKSFNEFAIQRLYRRVYIYAWHTEAKSKVFLLFQTLSNCPRLAQYVSRLEIRAFPKALSSSSLHKRIRNCVNLKSCAWTRDGSLEAGDSPALQQCPQLKELEINGKDSGTTLRNLTMICQVTHRGIGEIVSTNRNGLTGIGLERLSQQILQIYATTPTPEVIIADDFWKTIVTMHGSRLKRFSIDRMTISVGALHDVCSRCSVLEQLFVVTTRHNLDDVTRCFAAARTLRAIHVNFYGDADEPEERSMMNDALRIVQQCPATVTQIGCDTRVWHAELYTVPTLTSYENPDIPEQFLVARGA